MLKKIKILLIATFAILAINACQQAYSMANHMDIDTHLDNDNISCNRNNAIVYNESDDFVVFIESGDLSYVQEMVNLNPALLTQRYNLSTNLQIEHNHKLLYRNSFFGLTPLHLACHYGQIHIVKYLVEEKNLSIDAQDECGWLPILYASLNNRLDIVQYLCENKPYINPNLYKLTFSNNTTPDIYEVLPKDDIQSFLLKDKNNIYKRTIDIIEEFSKPEIFQYLKTKEDSIFKKLIEFHNIIANNNYDDFLQIMRELEIFFPTINSLFKNFIFFMSRIKANSTEESILNFHLIKHKYYRTELTGLLDPLQLAVTCENIDIVKYFIEEKNIDPKNIRYRKWLLLYAYDLIHRLITENSLETNDLECFDAYANLAKLGKIPPIIHLAPTVELVQYFINKGYTGNELTEYLTYDDRDQAFINLIASAAYYGKKEILEFLINELKFNPITGDRNKKEEVAEEEEEEEEEEVVHNSHIIPIDAALESQQKEIIELLTKSYNVKINIINCYHVVFDKKIFKNYDFLKFILLKIKEENGGKFNLNHFRDCYRRTIPNAIIDIPKYISQIFCNIYNTGPQYESDIRRLLENRTTNEDMNNIFIELLRASLEICECSKTTLKNAPALCYRCTNREKYFNFPNNLANCLIVFNYLSGAKPRLLRKDKGVKIAKTTPSESKNDPTLGDSLAAKIMSYGYKCFENPKNKAIIAALKEKNEQPKEKEQKAE